ncbi:glycoside hydrolase family 3 protein [Massilia sp. ZL223]|uniref:glycoside hydrolase family 3 protein n=1 Tax=Massilia sp. ZL223 TaxID=2824904 RepID=UPI001B8228AC|nr:glycoside hydrolase family 3 protein [Massilia sp. ZL223]MBQ5964339.1 exo 1,3/1,4-beta-D-glucan glucohydrolase [Massilia sp. ZL223]
MTLKLRSLVLALAATLPLHAGAAADWPKIASAVKPDAALEKRVAGIVARMTLAQKIGQMTQPEIKTATPADVTRYYLGSVLNGGGSWPNGNKHATAKEWLALAQAYHEASMQTDMAVKVPVIWGTDAVHGHNNVPGATLFPHNIGLGAARNPALVREIGAATAKAVRATGIAWVFGPTLAVVRDDRWGRTYESYAEDPAVVKSYAGEYVRGMQGAFKDANTVATAKHFIGDGGTEHGKDRGVTRVSEAELLGIHGQGYLTALGAGAQTVMASFNSWLDPATGKEHGKLHGSKVALTDILKNKMGFDGFVVSDWNGIGEVAGCRNDSCPQAINAGIDMIMVPDDWKAFIANTIKQVESGEIPMARIDDAVTRILRVKLRAGLFGKSPAQNAYAGKEDAMLARDLARQAVRESLVLLKNEGPPLPLARGKKILVVGKSADDLSNQSGGWSLTWQGTANTNADFKHADTILAGIRAAAGSANVTYSLDATDVDVSRFDAVIAVIGERPYAEGDGDIGLSGTLRHSGRYPEDLAVLRAVAGKGKPVITVMVSGRPLYANDLINLSDTFIAAWLPGSEGKGVSDLLIAGVNNYDFRGKLPFSWPKSACQTRLNVGDQDYAPLFAYGYGLKKANRSRLGKLDESVPAGGCGVSTTYPVFSQADRASFPLAIRSGQERTVLGADLNASFALPGITVTTSQVNTQQDAKLVSWTGPATVEARGARPMALPAAASEKAALRFDTIVQAAPAGKVTLAVQQATVDATALFKRLAGKGKQTVKVPLACFQGLDLAKVDTPFSLSSDAAFAAAFTNIEIAGGAAAEADAVRCEELR